MTRLPCVLGVLNTTWGVKARDEMLAWLSPLYDVVQVAQDPPGLYFEYPAIMTAFALAKDKPCLYLHTKGAANPHPVQQTIRDMWRVQFGTDEARMRYFEQVNCEEPRISTPIPGPNKETWFNAWVINATAAHILTNKTKYDPNRYVFECVARDTEVEVVSPNGGPYVDSAIFTKLEELLHA